MKIISSQGHSRSVGEKIATIGENSVIPDNVKIGRNTAISGVTTATNYPGGVLASGQVIKVKDGEQA